MAIFEKSQQAKTYVDPTYPMKASIENTQIVQGHTEYIIKVQNGWTKHGTIWNVYKRYNDFVQLNKEFKRQHVILTLPPKKYIGNLNQKFVTERQAALQIYLNSILSHHTLSMSAPIRKFLDIPNSVDSIKHFEDSALQHISMVLRSENQYSLGELVPSIGWRANKQYYAVNKISDTGGKEGGGGGKRGGRGDGGEKYILSWTQYGGDRTVPDKHMSCVVQMLTSLQHPCIAPILLFHSTDLGCVKVQSLAARGSLRDVLHASKQQSSDACALLSRESIVNISLQILRGLQFLHSKGLCHGHLHTGNILISPSGNIQLSDVDNYPLGLSSFYRPHFIHHRAVCSTLETVDVFCFGLVLWELCKRGSNNDISCSKNRSHSCDSTDTSSYCDILPSVLPDYLDLDLRALLESILSPRALQSSLPSVQVLLNQALFQGYVLPDYNNNNNSNRTSIKLSSSMKKYLSHMREKTLTRLAVDHKQFRHEKRLYRMESMIRADSDVSQYVIERSPSLCNTRTSEPIPPGLGHASPAEHTPTILSFSSQPSTPSGGVSERTPLNQPSPMSESEHTPQSSSSAHSDSVSQSLPPVGMNRGALLSSIQCFQKSSLRKQQQTGSGAS